MNDGTPTQSDLMNLKDNLSKKRDTLLRSLQEVESQLNSVITTMLLLGYGKSSPERSVTVPNLKGLTQLQALILIAIANDRKIKVTEIRDIFLREKLSSNPKNAYTIISNVIASSGRFTRIAPGEYELISEPDERDKKAGQHTGVVRTIDGMVRPERAS